MNDMPEFLPMIVMIFIILTFVAALGLFLALVFKRKPKSDLRLSNIDDRQDLENNEARYFQYIRFDADKKAIVLKQSQVFKKCVVTLVTKKGNSLKQAKYNLEYADGDLYCGIPLTESVDAYKVVLESVDGTAQKHDPIDNYLTLNLIYAIVVSVLFIIAGALLITMDSYYLEVEVEGFGIMYGLLALILIYVVVIVGGCLVGESLAKKGKFQYDRT